MNSVNSQRFAMYKDHQNFLGIQNSTDSQSKVIYNNM